jgi:hypothetical protein
MKLTVINVLHHNYPLRRAESLSRRVKKDLADIHARPALIRSFFHAPGVADAGD